MKSSRNVLRYVAWSLSSPSGPLIIAALASIVLYPNIADHEAVYPMMVVDLMPVGLAGLMIASFFAAFICGQPAKGN